MWLMNRRDYLKSSAVLLAGSVVPGCDGQGSNDAGPTGVTAESGFPGRTEMYEHGTPPMVLKLPPAMRLPSEVITTALGSV